MARFVATLVALLPLANAQSEWKSVCIQSTEVTLAPDGRRHAAVDCKWGGGDATRLTTMPEISPFILSKTVTLGVEGHMIEKVSNSDLSGATELRYLYLDNNVIKRVALGALKDCPQLRFVSFRRNNIHDLIVGTFAAQASLLYLDLSENLLETWRIEEVTGLKSLRYLNLADNPIESVGCGAFDHAEGLNFLNMSRTKTECAIVDDEFRCDCRALGTAVTNGFSHCDPDGCNLPVTKVSRHTGAIALSDRAIPYVANAARRWSVAAGATSEYLKDRQWTSSAEASTGGKDVLENSPVGATGTVALIMVASVFAIAIILVIGDRYKSSTDPPGTIISSEDSASHLQSAPAIQLRSHNHSQSTAASMHHQTPGIFIDMLSLDMPVVDNVVEFESVGEDECSSE